MGSGEIDQKWCHLHSQLVEKCRYPLCQLRANDKSYADFANKELLNTTGRVRDAGGGDGQSSRAVPLAQERWIRADAGAVVDRRDDLRQSGATPARRSPLGVPYDHPRHPL